MPEMNCGYSRVLRALANYFGIEYSGENKSEEKMFSEAFDKAPVSDFETDLLLLFCTSTGIPSDKIYESEMNKKKYKIFKQAKQEKKSYEQAMQEVEEYELSSYANLLNSLYRNSRRK